ncbi:PilN domain-containing protein [Thalassolituus sp. LLYu03]|uniref:PilN domain-containing protein n=1 Tax=Thalassolituus sp. LLYu03 TaxID=3421656 RepID=UPI003D277CA4
MSWNVRQRINFYTQEFRPPTLAAEVVLLQRQLLLVLMLGLGATVALFAARAWLDGRVSTEQALTHKLAALIAEEQSRRPPVVVDAQLQNQLEDARRRLENSQRVLTYLSREGGEQKMSFSPLVSQLGQVGVAGVWLTGFTLSERGQQVALRGNAQKASQISAYIGALAQQEAYAALAFRQVDIQENSQTRWLSFRLDTRPQPLAPGAAQASSAKGASLAASNGGVR